MSIKIKNLTVTFKNGVTAIRHADLEIPKGVYGCLLYTSDAADD